MYRSYDSKDIRTKVNAKEIRGETFFFRSRMATLLVQENVRSTATGELGRKAHAQQLVDLGLQLGIVLTYENVFMAHIWPYFSQDQVM